MSATSPGAATAASPPLAPLSPLVWPVPLDTPSPTMPALPSAQLPTASGALTLPPAACAMQASPCPTMPAQPWPPIAAIVWMAPARSTSSRQPPPAFAASAWVASSSTTATATTPPATSTAARPAPPGAQFPSAWSATLAWFSTWTSASNSKYAAFTTVSTVWMTSAWAALRVSTSTAGWPVPPTPRPASAVCPTALSAQPPATRYVVPVQLGTPSSTVEPNVSVKSRTASPAPRPLVWLVTSAPTLC